MVLLKVMQIADDQGARLIGEARRAADRVTLVDSTAFDGNVVIMHRGTREDNISVICITKLQEFGDILALGLEDCQRLVRMPISIKTHFIHNSGDLDLHGGSTGIEIAYKTNPNQDDQ